MSIEINGDKSIKNIINSTLEKFELNSKLIKPITTTELHQPAPRPLKSGLKSDKLIEVLNVVPPSIDDCLDAILEKNAK